VPRTIAWRLLGGVLTLWVVSLLVFAATEVLPGDPAQVILGKDATPQGVAVLRRQLGLDRPAYTRYVDWLSGVVRLDFGSSVSVGLRADASGQLTGTPVRSLIAAPLRNSAILGGVTLLFLVPLSFLLGTAAGVWQGSRLDTAMQVSTLSLTAIPQFVLAFILVLLFAIAWPVLPAVSFHASPAALVLPVATLVGVSVAYTSRMIRAGVVQILNSDYVRVARLKGLPERAVIRRHVIPNAIAPSLQAFALMVGWLAGGLVIVEAVFAYPGIGQGMVAAVSTRDLPVVQAYTLVIAAVYVVANLVADLLALAANPRLRTAQ
jgi:peptide/nickel transport system permease protein